MLRANSTVPDQRPDQTRNIDSQKSGKLSKNTEKIYIILFNKNQEN
jgi:hypothetical protein